VGLFFCTILLTDAQTLIGLPDDRPKHVNASQATTTFNPTPKNCSHGEEWTTCSSSSCFERRCDTPLTKVCTKDCKVGCHCAAGYARNGVVCLNESLCPPLANGNGNSSTSDPPSDRSLTITQSTIFNQTAQQCGQNEVWTKCSSSSCFEHRCDTVPSLLCTRDCVAGCKCADGFARLEKKCINETQCPPGLRNITSRMADLPRGKSGKGKLGKLGKRSTSAPTTNPPTLAPVTLYVGPKKQPCQKKDGTLGTKRCLVTKTVQAQQFVAHMKSIDGFAFIPGFAYKLRVSPTQLPSGEITYALVSVLNKTPANAPPSPAEASAGCPEVTCMVFCENGYKKDANDCEICSCLPSPSACPNVACNNNACSSGYATDAQGCTTCNCAPSSQLDCTSPDNWTLAKLAACCVPPPPAGSVTSALCKQSQTTGFVSH